MANSLQIMLALTARFWVNVQGVDLGGWARCKGLEVTFNSTAVTDGGNYQHQTILPGEIKYSKVVLERAISKQDTQKVLGWLQDRAAHWIDGHKSGGGGHATIVLYDSGGGEVTRWMLCNVYPESWKGPDLDAMSAGVAME